MADIAQGLRFEVDLDSGLVATPQIPVLMQGDKNADRIIISAKRGKTPVNLSGVSASATFIRASGDRVPVSGEVTGSEAKLTLNEHCYAEGGPYELQVQLGAGDERRTVLIITGRVRRKGNGRIIDIENVIPSIEDILAQLDVMREATKRAEDATKAATTAATGAQTQAQAAKTAAANANKAASKIDQMTATATGLTAGSAPTATVTDDGTKKTIALGIPAGKTPQISADIQTGAAGSDAEISVTGTAEKPVIHFTIPRGDVGSLGGLTVNGKAPDGAGQVTLTAADVGALGTGSGYEGGTWTPELRGESGAGDITYSRQDGFYWIVGKIVFYQAYLTVSAINTAPSGNLVLGNLPISARSMSLAYPLAASISGPGALQFSIGNLGTSAARVKDAANSNVPASGLTPTNYAYVGYYYKA